MARITEREKAWAGKRVPDLVDQLLHDGPALEIAAHRGAGNARIVDCGIEVRGSWEAGRRLAVLSNAGMMSAALGVCEVGGIALPELVCNSWRPPLSTHGLQVSFALTEVDPAIRV